jgi:hypothetical protein
MIVSPSLREVARHVNWYTDPDHVLADANLFLSQVMARGSTEDVIAVLQQFTQQSFRNAYLTAPAGSVHATRLVLLGPGVARRSPLSNAREVPWRESIGLENIELTYRRYIPKCSPTRITQIRPCSIG